MVVVVTVITGCYLFLLFFFYIGHKKIAQFKEQKKSFINSFSVVIPFRNEADNLTRLLRSVVKIKYPKDRFECIFVDDESTDGSSEVIHKSLSKKDLSYRVINNTRMSKSPKKDAIQCAIEIARFEWILTTDADCILPEFWLQQFDEFSNMTNATMVVGPVMLKSTGSFFLEYFQMLDFLSLQGATIGGFGIGNPFLCNGANLAYKKSTFLELNGFVGNQHVVSGDDIFLFEKFYSTQPSRVHFLKSEEAIVRTTPLRTWSAVVQQHVRWASKSSSYTLRFGQLVGLVVLAMNFVFVISLIGICSFSENTLIFLLCLLSKIGIDFFLIRETSLFYKISLKKTKGYALASLFYPFFSICVAFRAFTGKYTWKERNFTS